MCSHSCYRKRSLFRSGTCKVVCQAGHSPSGLSSRQPNYVAHVISLQPGACRSSHLHVRDATRRCPANYVHLYQRYCQDITRDTESAVDAAELCSRCTYFQVEPLLHIYLRNQMLPFSFCFLYLATESLREYIPTCAYHASPSITPIPDPCFTVQVIPTFLLEPCCFSWKLP